MKMSISWTDLIPLVEDNESYQPSLQEIEQYARYLGLSLPEDSKYLHLAEQALKAPLPQNWQACETQSGDLYYRNTATRQIREDSPLDQIYRDKVRQLKNIQRMYSGVVIDEESLSMSILNDSSGVLQGKGKSYVEAKNASQVNLEMKEVLRDDITEESIYSESQPSTLKKSSLHLEEVHLNRLLQIQLQLEGFIPQQTELITKIPSNNILSHNFKGVDTNKLNLLMAKRKNIEEKRVRLEKIVQERRKMQKTLSQLQEKHPSTKI